MRITGNEKAMDSLPKYDTAAAKQQKALPTWVSKKNKPLPFSIINEILHLVERCPLLIDSGSWLRVLQRVLIFVLLNFHEEEVQETINWKTVATIATSKQNCTDR